ncbi:MAG: DUF4468 domain-containing protein [Acidobacteriota bacterium]
MRKLFFALFLTLLAATAVAMRDARPFPRAAGRSVQFEGAVQVQGAPAAEIYARANHWARQFFVSSRRVVRSSGGQKDAMLLRATYSEPYGHGAVASFIWFHFTLSIRAEKGVCRWSITRITVSTVDTPEQPIEDALSPSGFGVGDQKAPFEAFRRYLLGMTGQMANALQERRRPLHGR